jgi:hypothetical protein
MLQTQPAPSPLVICDHLIAIAQEADRAGLTATARNLVDLAYRLFDEPPTTLRRPRRLAA